MNWLNAQNAEALDVDARWKPVGLLPDLVGLSRVAFKPTNGKATKKLKLLVRWKFYAIYEWNYFITLQWKID